VLKAAGLDRYHHNLETSRGFFSSICTTHTWEERVATVQAARAAGLDVCCGGLVGLGETMHDRAELAQAIRELGVSSVPLNFLEPIPGTPLGERARLAPEEALRAVVLFRLILPQAHIRICGGRARTMGEREYELLDIADCLMTGDYLTTAGPSPERDRDNALKLGYQPT
jgi:biotin synthase